MPGKSGVFRPLVSKIFLFIEQFCFVLLTVPFIQMMYRSQHIFSLRFLALSFRLLVLSSWVLYVASYVLSLKHKLSVFHFWCLAVLSVCPACKWPLGKVCNSPHPFVFHTPLASKLADTSNETSLPSSFILFY